MSDDEKKGCVGKVIAGLVIGGAIGSVLGLAFAPQRGEKTRKELKKKTDKAVEIGQKMYDEYQKNK